MSNKPCDISPAATVERVLSSGDVAVLCHFRLRTARPHLRTIRPTDRNLVPQRKLYWPGDGTITPIGEEDGESKHSILKETLVFYFTERERGLG